MPLRRPRPRPLPSRRPGARPVTTFALVAVALFSGACGDAAAPEAGPLPDPLITPSTFEVDPAQLQPLTMLGPCQDAPRPEVAVEAEGVSEVLPPEGFLVARTEQGELLNLRGYVAMTPLQFQVWLRERPGLEMLTVENEVQESETLWTDGSRRVFMKAAAVCELGSAFIAIVADEVDGAAVPTPSGSPQG